MNWQRIITRIKNMLLQPDQEWDAVQAENLTVKDIYTIYLVVVAAVPAVASFIGLAVVGVSSPFIGTVRASAFSALGQSVAQYVFSLAGVWVGAFIIDKLAPTFQSRPNLLNAVKLVAFASLPVWAAGILYLIPMLGALVLLVSLYAIYIFYVGLPKMMSTPSEKVIPYMIVSAVVMIVVYGVVGLISGALIHY